MFKDCVLQVIEKSQQLCIHRELIAAVDAETALSATLLGRYC